MLMLMLMLMLVVCALLGAGWAVALPGGVAVIVNFLLPDGHGLFQRVDAVLHSLHRIPPVCA